MFADIDHDHPEVRDDIKHWGEWVIKETGAEGFRFDAIKHIDRGFISDFVQHVRKAVGNDKMFCVGEFWKDSLDSLNSYTDSLGTQFSVFDTPLHYNFKEAGEAGNSYDMRKIFDGTVVQTNPIDAVTLVSIDAPTEPWLCLILLWLTLRLVPVSGRQPRHPGRAVARVVGEPSVQAPRVRAHPPPSGRIPLCRQSPSPHFRVLPSPPSS
jgi:hypothetical protein